MSLEGAIERKMQDSDEDQHVEERQDGSPGKAIARMQDQELLAPDSLDHRRLIHAQLRDHRQIDLVRELRTNVLTRASNTNPVLMVTGVSHGCGASFMARNLAASIALDEERTALLIDCNLRRPSQAASFSVSPDAPGLIDVFGGRDGSLARAIHATGVPRLRLIPAGQGTGRWIEFFASIRMRTLMMELRNRYDDRFLVIDAPPALGSPDARILAEHADQVILVVGEACHGAETIRRAAAAIPPERLAGVVFNHLP